MRRAVAAFFKKAYDDNLTGLAAMVAYNLILSVLPLALVALFVAGRILSSEDVEASVVEDLERLFPQAAQSTLLDGLQRVQESSTTVGILAVIAAVWFSSSFWGALDTAFCHIYHRECRSWVRQKLFALGMLAVVLLFFVASVSIPAVQGIVVRGSRDLPFGLGDGRGDRLLPDAGRRPADALRAPLPRLLARAARPDPVALRLAGRGRRGARDRASWTTPSRSTSPTSARCGSARRSSS